ncbi:hypothetical protein HDU97_005806 [Phlyctochytrium planicorne]|nr:hypothetical protein HDU97_005806 [Phlyctochytrium planicorne]
MATTECDTLSEIIYRQFIFRQSPLLTPGKQKLMGGYVYKDVDLRRIDCDLNLRVLNVSMYSMSLNGSVPDFSALTGLTLLELGANNYVSVPDVFGSLSNLEYLSLHSNPIIGTFPPSVGKLKKLQYLLMDTFDALSGPVPDLNGIPLTYACNIKSTELCLPYSNKDEYLKSQPTMCQTDLSAISVCPNAKVYTPANPNNGSSNSTKPTDSKPGDPSPSSPSGLSSGAIAGIVVALLLIVCLAVIGFIFRKKFMPAGKTQTPRDAEATSSEFQHEYLVSNEPSAFAPQPSAFAPLPPVPSVTEPATVLVAPPRNFNNASAAMAAVSSFPSKMPVISDGSSSALPKPPVAEWSTKDVALWLEENNIRKDITKSFEAHSISGRALLSLSEQHLENVMGIHVLGERLEIIALINTLKSDVKGKRFGGDSKNETLVRLGNDEELRRGETVATITSPPAYQE